MQERFKMFTVLIANINRCIHKIKTEEMAEFNLKSSHVSCLYYIYKEDSLTAKELCDMCGEDKANISRAIKYLETNELLLCNEQKQKRYQSPLELTKSGYRIGQFIAEKIDSVLNLASAGLSEEHRLIMYRSLNIINDNLSKICNDYDKDATEEM